MRDFDVDRAERLARERRSFKIGGEVFTCRVAVPPEAMVPWSEITTDTPEAEAIKAIDSTVLAFLESGQEARWQSVRKGDEENPVTTDDLLTLVKWLVEEFSGRPTTPPSLSSVGSMKPETGTSLTATSPLQEELV